MRVRELMSSEVLTCKDTDALADVARTMWNHDIGFMPVISSVSGALAGVITDRDGFIAAYFSGEPLSEITVGSAMTARVSTCRSDATIEDAAQIMSDLQVRRLPVVDAEGKLVGVLSINDLARRAATAGDELFEEDVALTLGAICHPRGKVVPAQAYD